jgi:hypothetical protein
LLVVSETVEREQWEPERDLPFDSVFSTRGRSIWLGSRSALGFRTRFDTHLYLPKRPLRALHAFEPDVVIPARAAPVFVREHRGVGFRARGAAGHSPLVGKLHAPSSDLAAPVGRSVGRACRSARGLHETRGRRALDCRGRTPHRVGGSPGCTGSAHHDLRPHC